MLVLSRNKNQKVNFPGLGISVEILDIQGSKVRVGVEAPMEVRILRDELVEHSANPSPASSKHHVIRLPQSLRHELRNTLNELSLMLHVYQKREEQKHAGQFSKGTFGGNLSPEKMFEAIVERLSHLTEHTVFSSSGLLSDEDVTHRPELGTALVVDDDDNERELLAGFLRMCGYQVDTARDGLEAIDYLETHDTPAFILLDMQMPRCDGASFLERLSQIENGHSIHVLVISGSAPEEYGLVPDDETIKWFSKPLDPRKVVGELQQLELNSNLGI